MHHLTIIKPIRNILWACIAIICYTIPSYASEQGAIRVSNYSYKDYHAHQQNWCMIEGNHGIRYFGNTSGILEYDGESWRLIELSNQSIARSMAKDNSGRIYVGGVNEFGYLSPDQKGKMIYNSLLGKLPDSINNFQDVWNTIVINDEVYFCTYENIFRLNNDTIQVIHTNDYIWGVFSWNEHLYYSAWGDGLKTLQNDSIINVTFANYFKNKKIWTFNKISDDKIMGLDENKQFYIIDFSIQNPNSPEDCIQRVFPEISKNLIDKNVYTFKQLVDGTIGIGTFSGFLHMDKKGKLLREINTKNGLHNDIIWSIYQDQDALIWLLTDNGISKIDLNSLISFWGKSQGINNSPMDIIRYNNTLYTASFGGLQYIENNQVKSSSLIKDECYGFLDFKNPERPNEQRLIVSSFVEGISELRGQKIHHLFNLAPWYFIQSKVNPSLVYCASDQGIYLFELKESKWQWIGKIKGIDTDIRDLYEDSHGDLWAASFLEGLYQIILSDTLTQPKEIIKYSELNGLPSLKDNYFFSLNNQLKLFTAKGLYRFIEKQQRFVPDSTFGKKYCDGSRSITWLKQDAVKRIWISGIHNNKTYLAIAIPGPEDSYITIDSPFTGLNESVIDIIYTEADSSVWFGSPEGLFHFKGEIPKSSPSYKCLVRKVTIAKDSVIYFGAQNLSVKTIAGLPSETNIDFEFNSIQFQFAAPFYQNGMNTQYQTWLEGYEKEWSDYTNERKIEYLNLLEGDYIFHVRAKNTYNTISREAVFEFSILPPWYRNPWMYFIYLFLLSSLVYLIVYLNSKRLKNANLRLEQIVADRTLEVRLKNTELENQKEEIITQHEQLQVYLEEMSTQKEEIEAQRDQLQVYNEELSTQKEKIENQRDKLENLNKTKDRFFSIIAHDLKSPFNSMIGLSDILSTESRDFSVEHIKKMGAAINQSAVKGFKLLENLLDWALSQTGGIKYEPEDLSINELIQDIVETYKNNAIQKSIQLVYVPKPEPNVHIDREMIHTVIRNLVSNAIKFTPESGSIAIYTSHSDNFVTVAIRDNGLGISEENQEKLFRLDTKFTTPGTAKEKGTGLGLLLCKEFVDKNHGQLTLKSTPGKGSTFTVMLPSGFSQGS